MDKITYFISGSSKYDVKKFIRDYVPLLKEALKREAFFVVGDCDGVDAMAQSYLKQNIPEDQHGRVKVFFKGDTPQNFLSNKFMPVPYFASHEEAAVAMTLCSDEDIACLEEGYWNSLTAKNILRRYTPEFNFERFAKAEKGQEKFWDLVFNKKEDKNDNGDERKGTI